MAIPAESERLLASSELTRLRTLTRVFDELVPIPYTKRRLGLDAVLGFLPGGGDLIGGAVSAYAILVAYRMGAPNSVIVRMAMNVGLDVLVGAVPLLGDIFDVAWKANRKNVNLLEGYLTAPQKVQRASVAVVGGTLATLALFAVLVVAAGVKLVSLLF